MSPYSVLESLLHCDWSMAMSSSALTLMNTVSRFLEKKIRRESLTSIKAVIYLGSVWQLAVGSQIQKNVAQPQVATHVQI